MADISYLGTVSGPLRSGKRPARTSRGSAPPAHGQQPPPSTQVSGRPWRRCRVCGLSLVLVGSHGGNHACRGFRLWAGGSGECAQTPHTGKVQQGRAATPATPATTFSRSEERRVGKEGR